MHRVLQTLTLFWVVCHGLNSYHILIRPPSAMDFCLQALLGMLGKLKRTLTKNVSEQRRISDEKGTEPLSNACV